jgi:hypothetical protein
LRGRVHDLDGIHISHIKRVRTGQPDQTIRPGGTGRRAIAGKTASHLRDQFIAGCVHHVDGLVVSVSEEILTLLICITDVKTKGRGRRVGAIFCRFPGPSPVPDRILRAMSYPFSVCLSPGSACDDVLLLIRGATGCTPFGQGLSAALAFWK